MSQQFSEQPLAKENIKDEFLALTPLSVVHLTLQLQKQYL